jgi:hypothetical protein
LAQTGAGEVEAQRVIILDAYLFRCATLLLTTKISGLVNEEDSYRLKTMSWFGPDFHFPLPIWSILLAILAFCSIIWVIYTRIFHPLAKFPGPYLASITRFWLVFDVARGSAEKTQRQLHAEYGQAYLKA